MPLLSNAELNLDASCREAEFMQWKLNAHRDLKANKNTDKESQAALLRNWLGATGERV